MESIKVEAEIERLETEMVKDLEFDRNLQKLAQLSYQSILSEERRIRDMKAKLAQSSDRSVASAQHLPSFESAAGDDLPESALQSSRGVNSWCCCWSCPRIHGRRSEQFEGQLFRLRIFGFQQPASLVGWSSLSMKSGALAVVRAEHETGESGADKESGTRFRNSGDGVPVIDGNGRCAIELEQRHHDGGPERG